MYSIEYKTYTLTPPPEWGNAILLVLPFVRPYVIYLFIYFYHFTPKRKSNYNITGIWYTRILLSKHKIKIKLREDNSKCFEDS
jgi:hypothetical protein